MTGLLSQIGAVGISALFARKALPSWWDDNVAFDPAGLQQAQIYISRAFNLDLKSLANESSVPCFRSSVRKFKLNRNVTEADVSVSAHFATAMAKLALNGVAKTQDIVPSSAAILRAQILEKHPCVSLEALLEWCADADIPVIHVEKLPGKKMTGLVVREAGRFAIVLSKKVHHPAYLLFHLAHELGHIANKHLSDDGFVADQNIGGGDSDDADEKEADAYAIRLINGGDAAYRATGVIRNGAALYRAAVKVGLEKRIDPGHIILNFGHHQNQFALANVALKSLVSSVDGCQVVNSVFFSHINADSLSDEQFGLLRIATGYTASV